MLRGTQLSDKTPEQPTPPGTVFHPLYQQIKRQLMDRMTGGEWMPGMIPSEVALAQHYGVSVGTLRKAVHRAGAGERRRPPAGPRHGGGHPRGRPSAVPILQPGRRDGERALPVSRVLGCTARRATADERGAMGLKPNTRVLEIVRVRELDGAPAVLKRVLLDAQRFVGLEKQPALLPNTLYQLY